MNAPTPRDITWTGTGGLSDTQSYAYIIQNAIFDRISSSSFFANFICKRISTALQIEHDIQIPFVGVFRGEENMIADGDLNAGDIRFIHQIPIGIQVVVKNNDPAVMLGTLDRASWFVLNQILRDNTFTNRWLTSLPDSVSLEGFSRINIRTDTWGLTGARNEVPVGARLFWITIQLRTWFAPTDFPDLERITVTTAFPPGQYEPGEIHQVKIVYEFTPDSVPTPLPPDPP